MTACTSETAPTGEAVELPLLSVRDLTIERATREGTRTFVTIGDLRIAVGETVGIVGESGSGKSLTARSLVQLLPAGFQARGEIRYCGTDVLALAGEGLRAVRGRAMAYLPQDPFTMLNPLRRCGTQIADSLVTAHESEAALRAEIERRLSEVGVKDAGVADRYPFELSGGLRQRVAIAAALAADPDLLIADEPSTALDVTTQRAILAKLREVQRQRGMGIVLISHDLRLAFAFCDRVHVLYGGALLEHGPAGALHDEPLHPYSLGLLLSEPPLSHKVARLASIPGKVPTADDVLDRCAFADRCQWAADVCVAGRPPLVEYAPGRHSACVRLPEIRDEMRRQRAQLERAVPAEAVASDGEPLVCVEGLRKVFSSGRRAAEVQAVRGVAITVERGECVGLVGESGSGKTTLARCLVGLETPTAGSLSIDGIDASDYRALSKVDRRHLRRSIQYVFQDPYASLNPSRTVARTLDEAIRQAPAEEGLTIAQLLEMVGLRADYAKRKPSALSGGERQRVAIARALAVRPQILICDEPVSALDVSVQAQVLTLLSDLRRDLNMAMLFITHDLAVVRQAVDRAYVMLNGEIVEANTVDRLLEHPSHEYTRTLIRSVPSADGGWLA